MCTVDTVPLINTVKHYCNVIVAANVEAVELSCISVVFSCECRPELILGMV
jgi:hypothetical protein